MKAVRRFERELARFTRAMNTSLRGAPIDGAGELREEMISALKILRQYDANDETLAAVRATWEAERKKAEISADEVVKNLVGPAQKVRGTRDSRRTKEH